MLWSRCHQGLCRSRKTGAGLVPFDCGNVGRSCKWMHCHRRCGTWNFGSSQGEHEKYHGAKHCSTFRLNSEDCSSNWTFLIDCDSHASPIASRFGERTCLSRYFRVYKNSSPRTNYCLSFRRQRHRKDQGTRSADYLLHTNLVRT